MQKILHTKPKNCKTLLEIRGRKNLWWTMMNNIQMLGVIRALKNRISRSVLSFFNIDPAHQATFQYI
jgi:hypothetical protein